VPPGLLPHFLRSLADESTQFHGDIARRLFARGISSQFAVLSLMAMTNNAA
jgi:hypothetical protein